VDIVLFLNSTAFDFSKGDIVFFSNRTALGFLEGWCFREGLPASFEVIVVHLL